MRNIMNFPKFLESVKTLEVGYDIDDKTSNSLSEDSLENLADEIQDFKRLKSKVESIIIKGEGEDVSSEVDKIITKPKTYGTNRFLRMYSSICFKKKQVEDLETKMGNDKDELREIESSGNEIDRTDREAVKEYQDKVNKKKEDLSDSNKKLKDLQSDIKEKDKEIAKFMKDVEKEKQDNVDGDKWESTIKK